MAKAELIKATGSVQEIEPKNGTDFSLEELHKAVGGWIQVIHLKDGKVMVCHEEGKIMGLMPNENATDIAFENGILDYIVGNVVVCDSDMIK